MADLVLIRSRFESMSPSELTEEIAKPDDYTPEAYAILTEVAEAQGIESQTPDFEAKPESSWRRKLRTGEVEDWYLRFDRAAIEDEGTILNRDMSSSLGGLMFGMLIANGLFLMGLTLSLVFLAGGLIAYVLFIGGILFAKRFILIDKDPLELRRWKRCWQADFVGYNLSLFILGPLLLHGLKTYEAYVNWSLVVVGISLSFGMLTGLLGAQLMDKNDKQLVVEAFRAWKLDRTK